MTIPPACQTSPAADRNKGPILAALQGLLPSTGAALEIAAGTGQHAVHFAAGLPGWVWQATDPAPSALASISAWAARYPSPGLRPPLALDVLAEPWASGLIDTGPWDLVFCANLLHIAPWTTCAALMRGAARLLSPTGLLVTYGPYRVEGEPLAAGNQAFDADLRARNPAWGLRWLHEVDGQAVAAGLQRQGRLALPANNQLLVFGRSLAPAQAPR